jgi:hypothetical protein
MFRVEHSLKKKYQIFALKIGDLIMIVGAFPHA